MAWRIDIAHKMRRIQQHIDLIFLIAAFVISIPLLSTNSFGQCNLVGNHITLLKWSKDGNSALMMERSGAIVFDVIEGGTGLIHSFPFYEDEQCQKNMEELTSLLNKDGIESIPLLSKKPCGLSLFSNSDLGSQRPMPKMLKTDIHSGEYQAESGFPFRPIEVQFEWKFYVWRRHPCALSQDIERVFRISSLVKIA